MNRLTGVLYLLFLLPLAAQSWDPFGPIFRKAIDTRIEFCKKGEEVCVSFVNDQCKIRGANGYEKGKFTEKQLQGVLWDDNSRCKSNVLEILWSRLDFHQITPYTWGIDITACFDIWKSSFVFGGGNELKFLNGKTAQFKWKGGIVKMPIEEIAYLDRGYDALSRLRQQFYKYRFNITVPGQKIMNLLGVLPIIFKSTEPVEPKSQERPTIILSDPRFVDWLTEQAPCDELKPTCYGGCNETEIMKKENRDTNVIEKEANCSTTWWFRAGPDNWKTADTIKCSRGNWQAEWTGNSAAPVVLDSSVQCSADRPVEPPKPGRLFNGGMGSAEVIGISLGAVLLVAVLGVVFYFMWKRKRNNLRDTTSRKGTTRSQSDAPTHSKKKSGSDRNGSTEAEGRGVASSQLKKQSKRHAARK